MWITGLIICFGWIFSLCFHEFSHALVAYWGGDKTVKDKGYLTFNPFKYTQPGLSIILPLVFILIGGMGLPGGAVYINHKLLKNRAWDSWVSAAGPTSNILFALVLILPFWLLNNNVIAPFSFLEKRDLNFILSIVFPSLAYLIYIEIFAIIFNLLPIPGLDGYGIIKPWLPEEINQKLSKYSKHSYYFIFGLFLFVPKFNSFFFSIIRTICESIGVPEEVVYQGRYLFHQPINKFISILIIFAFAYLLKFNEHNWYQKGNKLTQQEKDEAAIAAYNKAIKIKPDYGDAWLRKADAYYRLKNYPEAIKSYRKAIEFDRDEYDVWLFLGHSFANINSDPEAVEAYQKAIALGSTENKDNNYVYLAQSLFNLDRKEEAIATINKGLEINSQNYTLQSMKANYFYNCGQYKRAIEAYHKVIELNPEKQNSWLFLGHSFANINSDPEAVEAYQKAIALDSTENKDKNYLYLAQSLFNLDRKEEAITTINKGLKINSQNNQLWVYKVNYLYNLKKYQEIINCRQLAPNLEKDNIEFYYFLGLALTRTNKSIEATKIFEQIATLEPKNILSLLGKAEIHYLERAYPTAIELYQKAIDLQPDYFTAWYNMACCYALEPKPPEAIAALIKAMELEPEKTLKLIEQDEDFTSLKDTPEFQRMTNN